MIIKWTILFFVCVINRAWVSANLTKKTFSDVILFLFLVTSYIGIGMSAGGVNLNKLPGEFLYNNIYHHLSRDWVVCTCHLSLPTFCTLVGIIIVGEAPSTVNQLVGFLVPLRFTPLKSHLIVNHFSILLTEIVILLLLLYVFRMGERFLWLPCWRWVCI